MVDKLKIEMVDISKIKEYEHNAKLHPEWQIKQIANSIKKFGFNDPVSLDSDMVLIEGHGRLRAAKILKMKKVPVIKLGHLSEMQKKAYIIAHNKLTMNTGFDEAVLKKELDIILNDADFDIDLSTMGFFPEDIEPVIEEKEVEKLKTFEEKFNETTDQNAKMPIVPEFFEKHECFIIPAHNEIDVLFIRDLFGLNENHISESGDKKVRKTNVISLEALRCLVK